MCKDEYWAAVAAERPDCSHATKDQPQSIKSTRHALISSLRVQKGPVLQKDCTVTAARSATARSEGLQEKNHQSVKKMLMKDGDDCTPPDWSMSRAKASLCRAFKAQSKFPVDSKIHTHTCSLGSTPASWNIAHERAISTLLKVLAFASRSFSILVLSHVLVS